MSNFYQAKVENLVKVAATKDSFGRVFCAKRMRGGDFQALVRAGWVERHDFGGIVGRAITAAGQARLDAYQPEDVFASLHGRRALETFRQVGTEPTDWFHPAVNWVQEERLMMVPVDCPDCQGEKFVRHGPDGAVVPMPEKAHYGQPGYYEASKARSDYHAAARAETTSAERLSSWSSRGNCSRCLGRKHGELRSTGVVLGLRMRTIWIGYVVWPDGATIQNRFGLRGTRSDAQCALCGKGIPSGILVPLAHDRGGINLGMWVGADCAKKFVRVAELKPDQGVNSGKLQYLLADNYIQGRS